MKRYWIRIAVMALVIFAVGMVVVNAGRRGVDHVKQLASEHSLRLTPDMAPFQVDGQRLGELTRVSVDPRENQGFPLLRLTVRLDPNAELAALGDCVIVASDAGAVTRQHGLSCVPGASPDSMVEMGTVRFEPSEEERSIYIPASQLAASRWFDVKRIPGQPGTSGGEAFNLKAGPGGAFLMIRDEKGRPIFQLNADSHGAFIQVRDSNGNEVMRFRADSSGVIGGIEPQ